MRLIYLQKNKWTLPTSFKKSTALLCFFFLLKGLANSFIKCKILFIHGMQNTDIFFHSYNCYLCYDEYQFISKVINKTKNYQKYIIINLFHSIQAIFDHSKQTYYPLFLARIIPFTIIIMAKFSHSHAMTNDFFTIMPCGAVSNDSVLFLLKSHPSLVHIVLIFFSLLLPLIFPFSQSYL